MDVRLAMVVVSMRVVMPVRLQGDLSWDDIHSPILDAPLRDHAA